MLEHLPAAVGRAFSEVRAGLDDIAFNRYTLGSGTAVIAVSSLSFADHAPIPQRFTADGEGHFPSISWTGVPAQAAALVLLVEDADSPSPHPFMHLSLLNLPAQDGTIAEGDLAQASFGPTSFFTHQWVPPDPPPGHGPHRYAFQVFALREAVPGDVSKGDLLEKIGTSAMASGLLIGTYERSDMRALPLDGPVLA